MLVRRDSCGPLALRSGWYLLGSHQRPGESSPRVSAAGVDMQSENIPRTAPVRPAP